MSLGPLVLSLFLLAFPQASGQPDPGEGAELEPDTRFSVAFARDQVLLGDAATLEVRGPLGSDAALLRDGWPDDVLLRADRVELLDDGTGVLRQELAVAREGTLELDTLVLLTGGEPVLLPPASLEVVLDLPPAQVPRMAGPLAPLDLPRPTAPLWPWLVGVLGALAALGFWIWRVGRIVIVPVHEPAPEAVAVEALARLRAHLPRTTEEVLSFILDVSDVLRRYLEGRFSIHAPSQTTEEFLLEAGRRHDEVASRRELLEGFLVRCDLVKFARHRPAPGDAVSLLDTAEAFVEETRA